MSIVAVGGTTVGGSVCPVVTGSPCGLVRMSLCVGPAKGEASIGPMPCRADFPEGVDGCSSIKAMSSSSGDGEPEGE